MSGIGFGGGRVVADDSPYKISRVVFKGNRSLPIVCSPLGKALQPGQVVVGFGHMGGGADHLHIDICQHAGVFLAIELAQRIVNHHGATAVRADRQAVRVVPAVAIQQLSKT